MIQNQRLGFSTQHALFLYVLTLCFIMLTAQATFAQSNLQTLIKNATIVPLAEGDDSTLTGDLLISPEGTIAAISQEPLEPTLTQGTYKTVDATGKIIIPGFVSGHSHLWQSVFRGIAADGELWPWLEALHWTYGKHFEKGDFYAFTLHGALDQLAHGVTTTYNHSHWLKDDYNLYIEQYQAELVAGQHFIFAFAFDLKQDMALSRKHLLELITLAQEQKAPTPLLGFSINARGMYRDVEFFKEEIAVAKELNLTTQMHYLEPSARQEQDRAKFPEIKEAGGLYDGMSFAHFIHTTDSILEDTAAAGASMIWNPLSNGRLGSGLADIPKYLEMGVGVGMGVDGQASADISDPFENMRMGLYALRMQQQNAQGMQPVDILRLHTLNTAQVLKVDDKVGSLEVGKYADLLIVDPQSPMTGPVFDPLATLVFACDSKNIEQVYVRGQLLVQEGICLQHDIDHIIQDVDQRIARIKASAQ